MNSEGKIGKTSAKKVRIRAEEQGPKNYGHRGKVYQNYNPTNKPTSFRNEENTSEAKYDVVLKVPRRFSFINKGDIDFNQCFSFFDWSIADKRILIDFKKCKSANYSSLTLFVLYLWHLTAKNCKIDVAFENADEDVGKMWRMLGATNWKMVFDDINQDFHNYRNKLLRPVRNYGDFNESLSHIQNYIGHFDISYSRSLRNIISEVVYNTIEHGKASVEFEKYSKANTVNSECELVGKNK